MRFGWYISGAGHLLLLVVVLFGGVLSRDRLPELSVSEVTVISEAEFAALTAPQAAPDIADEAPSVEPVAPDEPTPEAPAADTPPETADPDTVAAPSDPEDVPDAVPQPIPDALVEDEAPVIDTPPTLIDGTSPVADATPSPAPRVAPTPAIAPPPLIESAPEVVEDTAPDPDADPERIAEPEETPAAPDEASDRIVTEAEEVPDVAPATSMRPRTRPVRTAVVAPEDTPEPAPEPQRDPQADAIAAAVSEAVRPAPTSDLPVGPPLTGGEKDALRVSVQRCWNVGSLSTEALATTVVVGVDMAQDGTPQTGSIRLLSHSGGSASAAQQAFEAARRAIIRCGARGFPLPVEKYAEWRDIEMTFNPEGMQFR